MEGLALKRRELGNMAYCNSCGHYIPLKEWDDHRELCLELMKGKER